MQRWGDGNAGVAAAEAPAQGCLEILEGRVPSGERPLCCLGKGHVVLHSHIAQVDRALVLLWVLCESQAELSRGEGEKQVGMGILTAPQGFGFVGVQHRDAPRLSSTSGLVQDPDLNASLELDAGLRAILPCVGPNGLPGAWAGARRGWWRAWGKVAGGEC